ncbi:MAG: hypothetical protein RR923_06890 [Bacilli bacterium]
MALLQAMWQMIIFMFFLAIMIILAVIIISTIVGFIDNMKLGKAKKEIIKRLTENGEK